MEQHVALAGCRIWRPAEFAGAVEVVRADAAPRKFPTHVTDSLGICWKHGPAHEVHADGRSLRYPANSVCLRMPGCVWASELASVGFTSVDIAASLLSCELPRASMRFAAATELPALERVLEGLLDLDALRRDCALGALLVAASDEPRDTASAHLVARACEALASDLAEPLSLDALAARVGVNKFALIRAFRRETGTTPYRYRIMARIGRARNLLAQGAAPADVATQLGFADQAHLSRCFKQLSGLPPSRYARVVQRGAAPVERGRHRFAVPDEDLPPP